MFVLSDSYLPYSPFQGTYAQFALVKEEWIAAPPDAAKMSLSDSAAVPLVALTAVQALEKAAPKAGQSILIFGASGGVGHIAVQLAKAVHGLEVTAVSSKKYADWVKSLGADSVWEYDTNGGEGGLKAAFGDKKFDIVLDVIGGKYVETAYKECLKKDGFLTHVLNRGGIDAAFEAEIQKASDEGTGPKFAKTLVQPSGEQLGMCAKLISEGKLTVKVAQVLPLEEAGKGHDVTIDGHAGGKVCSSAGLVLRRYVTILRQALCLRSPPKLTSPFRTRLATGCSHDLDCCGERMREMLLCWQDRSALGDNRLRRRTLRPPPGMGQGARQPRRRMMTVVQQRAEAAAYIDGQPPEPDDSVDFVSLTNQENISCCQLLPSGR